MEAEIGRDEPALLAAVDEVDVTLIEWSLGLSPFERLRACTRATRALIGWRRVPSEGR